ncbi:iron transporter [Nostoc sp. 3335mG]|nr:iron transporter [Nostoc sp. 3335mG]
MLDPSDATRAAFEAWRCMSAGHDAAYARVSAMRDAAQALAEQPVLLSLRQQTLARAALAPKPWLSKRRAIAGAALLLAGAPLAALGIHAWSPKPVPPTGETFRTGIGQQADVTLPDGSTVTLDTASRLEVRYDGDTRRVLLDGQGWFRLRPSDKPFLISAGGHSFTAAAGSFDVRTDPGQVRAFAADGTLSLAGGDSSVALASGNLLAARGNDVTIRRLDDPASFTGWRTGLLQFDDVPVAQAANELNRYRRRPIRIADSGVASLHVSGAFHTAETPAFVDALTAGFPVRVKQDSSEGVVIASR